MGLLEKYGAYRLMGGGRRGGGDPDAGLAMVIIFGTIAILVAIVWITTAVLSFTWGIVYQAVRPILALYPPLTVPLGAILFGWLFTLIGPYPTGKAKSALDGNDDSLSFLGNAILAIVAINTFLLVASTESIPEGGGITGILLTLLVIIVLLYGMYKFFHLPYQCIRLLLHAPNGTRYVILFLFPILFPLLIAAFEVPLNIPVTGPTILDSELGIIIGALAMTNAVHVGGSIAVLWKQDEIRDRGFNTSNSRNTENSPQ